MSFSLMDQQKNKKSKKKNGKRYTVEVKLCLYVMSLCLTFPYLEPLDIRDYVYF